MEDYTIYDSQITSSSNYQGYPAWKGRLNGDSCWAYSQKNSDIWFQVDFVFVVTITAIQTQGCQTPWGNEYVTDLQVAIGNSQDSLFFIQDDNGMVKVSVARTIF